MGHFNKPAISLGLLMVIASSMLFAANNNPTSGEVFRECTNCPEMIVVPAGTYMMGTPDDEANRNDDEYLHEVTIARPFAMSRTEITWIQWEACVRDGACDGEAVDRALRLDMEGNPNPD